MNRSTSPTARFLFAQAAWSNTGEAGAHLSLSTTSNLGQTTAGINQFINILDVLKLRDNLDQIITHILNSPDVNDNLKARIRSELRWQKQLQPADNEGIGGVLRELGELLGVPTQTENSREIENALRAIINERDKAALSDDPAYYQIDQAINHARTLLCTCGNPQMGFDCSCNWTQKHPGTTQFSCGHCGIYDAAKPRCNLCQVNLPVDEDENGVYIGGVWHPKPQKSQ